MNHNFDTHDEADRPMRIARALSLLTTSALVLSGVTSRAGAQSETTLTLADASFPEPFSTVRGVHELSDGRVLVADGLGQALMIVDIAGGTADTIGRVGAGPGEYRMPDGIFPYPGNVVLLVDLGNGRLTILDADLEFIGTHPIMVGGGEGLGRTALRLPRATDDQGRIYYQQSAGIQRGRPVPDSAMIVRWDPALGAVDTVASVKVEQRELQSVAGGIRMAVTPLSPMDGWAVARDGSIALVRSGDYHVEWIKPNGRLVRGPAHPYTPVRIGKAEKEAWLNTRTRDGLSVVMDIDGGGSRQATFSRGSGPRRQLEIADYDWPEYMQGFVATEVYVSPDGGLWVQRAVETGAPVTFDVLDTAGDITRRVILPAGRQIVAFGTDVLYTVRADEFDLMWLEMFRIGS